MRSKVTVVLLFLNVVLFAYIYFYDNPHIEKLQTLSAVRRVFGPEAATITSFTRTSRTGEKIKLEKDKNTETWKLTVPYQWPASPNAISSLLNAIELLEHETSFPVADLAKGGRSLADYGLAEPALGFEFTSGDHPPYVVQIGDVTAVGNRLYLLSPDKSRIHVVNRSFAEAIGLPIDTLRAPSIFSVPVFEVRSLNIQTRPDSNGSTSAPGANLKVRVKRDAASRWAFEAPITARANKAAVEVTINAVNALVARNFVDSRDTDVERAGLNTPILQVTLEGNARRESLLIGNPTGNTVPREGSKTPDTEYFAKLDDNPVIFTTSLPKELLTVLKTAQENLRDAHVMDVDPANVTALTLVAPGQPELTLQKLEGDQGWQAVVRVAGAAPQTTPADTAVVTNLLQKITQLSAHEPRPDAPKFLSDAPSATDLENWGFNRATRKITLNLAPGAAGGLTREATALTLEIGTSPDKPGEAFARTSSAPYVYQVLPDILDETPVAARHYRNRLLRELPEAARITSLKLSTLPGNTAVLHLNDPNAITPESLATATLNPPEAANGSGAPAAKPLPEKARAVLASLLAQVRTLRARSFTGTAFNPDHAETATGPQPWKYQLDVVTSYAAGTAPAQNSTLSLLLTERLGGTTMLAGTTEFGGVVYEVTQEFLDAVFALTYSVQQDPGAPKLEPAAAAPEPPPPAKS